MSRGVFVTATDTGVGKTVVACAIVRALRAREVDVHPFKPVAAGATRRGDTWINEDTVALLAAAGLDASSAELVTPVLLREAIAPHIAAEREERAIELAPIRTAFERIAASHFVVAEGVGGFLVPLGEKLDSVELARALGLPVVLVVGLRLGCLNHALLTARAIEQSQLPFAGWIANRVDAGMAAADENIRALERRLRAPLLGDVPHRVPPQPEALASAIDVAPLLELPP